MNAVKKVLVISDTHKNISNAIDIIIRRKPDYILHLGDFSEDADDIKNIFPEKELFGISGNCDWAVFTNAPNERIVDIDGVRILMSHGHMYNVKSGIANYVQAARDKGVNIALFGHTHIPILDNTGDIILMNPGTVNTYGWIEIADGKASAKMFNAEE